MSRIAHIDSHHILSIISLPHYHLPQNVSSLQYIKEAILWIAMKLVCASVLSFLSEYHDVCFLPLLGNLTVQKTFEDEVCTA